MYRARQEPDPINFLLQIRNDHLIKGGEPLDPGSEVASGQQQVNALPQLHVLFLILANVHLIMRRISLKREGIMNDIDVCTTQAAHLNLLPFCI